MPVWPDQHRQPPTRLPPETDGTIATASTDMGHDGQDGSWEASDMQVRVDFAYRRVHTAALIAKRLIEAYYGQPAIYAYFSGCSDVGREALMQAPRYPADFNGIAAETAARNFLAQNSCYHGWNAKIDQPDSANLNLTAAQLSIRHAAIVAACNAADGVEDGLISNPPACTFDPQTLLCANGVTPDCLPQTAIAAAREVYRGAHAGDIKLVGGSMQPGSELAWAGVAVAAGAMPGAMQQDATATDTTTSTDTTAAPATGNDQPQMTGGGMDLSPIVAAKMLKSLDSIIPNDPN